MLGEIGESTWGKELILNCRYEKYAGYLERSKCFIYWLPIRCLFNTSHYFFKFRRDWSCKINGAFRLRMQRKSEWYFKRNSEKKHVNV
jgi:hypothetical protein